MDNKKIWDDNWNKIADYSTNSAGNRWAFYLIEKVLRNIELDDGMIIDAGCGMGNKTAHLAKLYPYNKIVGMDFSKEGLDFASKYYKKLKNLSFEYGDVTQLDKADNIQMITSFEVVEHIDDWKAFLGRLCEISDRYILLSTPTGRMRSYEKNIGHYRNLKKGEIEHFMRKRGYRRVNVLYAGFPFWSPLTRDFFDLHSKLINKEQKNAKKKDEQKSELVATYNPFVHELTYLVYRYLCFDTIGDQFMGLFEKQKDIKRG